MIDVLAKIQELHELLKTKLQNVERREIAVADKEKLVTDRETTHSGKHQELLTREAAVSTIENTEAQRTANQKEAESLSQSRASLKEERDAFALLQKAHASESQREREAVAAAWVEVKTAKANIEKEVQKQIEEVLKKFRKE